ncbi:uncharacterized protein RJT21DRAFT_117956 [Scheffersomyces amazonensis]|uniref:uncharacterized protein n=1 Tax=Scheffersomyces amazonensis TaxID=1078765 RepID=UPI00315D4A18
MSRLLEVQRSVLEELNVVEEAISDRFKRNPSLNPKAKVSKVKKSQKQRLIQQHEIKLFEDKYIRGARLVLNHKLSDISSIRDEISDLADPEYKFTRFDELLAAIKDKHHDDIQTQAENIKQQYRMYSASNEDEKRKNILSSVASHLNFSELFTEQEDNGKYLNLTSSYNEFQLCTSNNEISYVEYLSTFTNFPVSNINNVNAYKEYLTNLSNYLQSFIVRTHPLSNLEELLSTTNSSTTTKSESNDLFCEACHKLFTKSTVYDAHLSGKKHIKNSKASHSEIKLLETKIQDMANVLKTWKDATIANTERRLTMTQRERELERLKATEESEEDIDSSDSSESDNDDEDSYYKNLPLGADGKPIPFWLYKLQGLHKTYSCEICGDITYKGKSVFVKHFGGPKHQYGLKFIGVEDEYMSLFKSIISIEEAQKLWNTLKQSKKQKDGDIETAVEVEDSEGNVMSEKDYLDLKKQGLL